MATSKKGAAIRIRNNADGPRSYPLKDGGSVHLPARPVKGSAWVDIAAEQWSAALSRAERKGLITRAETDDTKGKTESTAEEVHV